MKYAHHPEDFDQLILPYLRLFISLSARRSDRVITVSQYAKNELVKSFHLKDEKVSVIYYGVNQAFNLDCGFDAKNQLRREYAIKDKYILCVAALKSHKNVLL